MLGVMWQSEFAASLPWVDGDLAVRLSQLGDGQFLYDLNQDPDVIEFLGGPLGHSATVNDENLIKGPHNIQIATLSGAAIGYTAFIENDYAEGMDVLIVISAAHRSRGVGRRLLSLLTGGWKACFPEKSIAITTRAENAAAQRLLESCNYRKVGEYHDQLNYHHFVFREAAT